MIVVVGSINLDLVAHVTRLPAAGETIAGQSFATHPGGKGANQALAARRAGATVTLVGAVGADAFAEPALALLRSGDVDLRHVAAVDAPTGVALIHVDAAGENSITVVAGANGMVGAAMVPDALLAPSTLVLMPLEIPLATVVEVAKRARAAGAHVVLNAAPASALDATLLSLVDVLVVNEHEAAVLARPLGLPAEPAAFCAAMSARFGHGAIATLGAQGAVAATPDQRIAILSPRVGVVDTVGAGDALTGALAAALDRGATLREALAEGVAAGALACTRRGAQPALPARADIARLAATI